MSIRRERGIKPEKRDPQIECLEGRDHHLRKREGITHHRGSILAESVAGVARPLAMMASPT